jgi:hypothetical protein
MNVSCILPLPVQEANQGPMRETCKSLFKFCFCKRKGSVLGSGKAIIPGIATLFQELLQQTARPGQVLKLVLCSAKGKV